MTWFDILKRKKKWPSNAQKKNRNKSSPNKSGGNVTPKKYHEQPSAWTKSQPIETQKTKEETINWIKRNRGLTLNGHNVLNEKFKKIVNIAKNNITKRYNKLHMIEPEKTENELENERMWEEYNAMQEEDDGWLSENNRTSIFHQPLNELLNHMDNLLVIRPLTIYDENITTWDETGSYSNKVWQLKHENVYLFPSSIDIFYDDVIKHEEKVKLILQYLDSSNNIHDIVVGDLV
jgi:hypothetical protein